MGNRIPEVQNQQSQLERLSAQRELYSCAKRFFLLQTTLTLILPVGLSFFSIYFPGISEIAALYGVCIFVIDLVFIEPRISVNKIIAAKIQELFDCSVFEIEHSPLRVVKDVSVEKILIHYEAHKKIASNIEKIKDWYPKAVGEVDLSIGRIICQRSSCWWDKNLRAKYCQLIKVLPILIPLILLIIAFIENVPTTQAVLILSSLVPFFQFTIKYYNDNRDMDFRLEKLSNYIEDTWNNILRNNLSTEQITAEARVIQDAIYDNRVSSPLVFDGFYKLFRKKDELTMNRAAEILVEQIKTKRENN